MLPEGLIFKKIDRDTSWSCTLGNPEAKPFSVKGVEQEWRDKQNHLILAVARVGLSGE